MAVRFYTENGHSLLNAFNTRISQKETTGKITTWERSEDGVYYTHRAKEWNKKAWFKPVVYSKYLAFNIIKPKNSNISITVYGYYHGHLIETFLNHFDDKFDSGEGTARAISGDNVSD